VRVYNLNAGLYPLNPAHNNFVFEINREAITQVPFRGEVLKVKGMRSSFFTGQIYS